MERVTIVLRTNRILSRHAKRVKNAQIALDKQVLQDSNVYIPYKTGALKASGIRGTRFGSGKVIWAIFYAVYQYWSYPNKSKAINNSASMLWFRIAKRRYRKKWEKKANAEYHR